MKCNAKVMLTSASLLVALAAVGYWAAPQFRSEILGLIPFASLLICPLSMAVMMWLMNRRDHRHDSPSPSPSDREITRSARHLRH
ncbi:MAG: DUF2933 domain-containing protein [Paraburkholderia sp.]|nr:MAG: DUF2933 domain-containing protein [Paraburkholderia sp.]